MSEANKKIILTHSDGGWKVTIKGDFVSVRDMKSVSRALTLAHRSYLRKRRMAKRKEG